MDSENLTSESENTILLDFAPEKGKEGFHYPVSHEDGTLIDDFVRDILLRVDITDVIPGTRSPDGDLATLVLIDCHFQGFTGEKGIKEFKFNIFFEDAKKRTSYYPTVVNLWPDDEYVLNESKADMENKTTLGAKLGGSGGGVDAGVDATWERSSKFTRVNHARLTAQSWSGPQSRTKNGLKLFMEQNPKLKDGIPASVQIGVLLYLPKKDIELSALVDYHATGGYRFNHEWKEKDYGKVRRIDSSKFTPRKSMKSKAIESTELDEVDLEARCKAYHHKSM
jgi:hypothetical protein